MKSSKKAFTLVELIIVIAIIAILAVTAFLLLTKRLSKARDSSRASNLANIENSLQISITENSSLPKPDSYTLIYASGTTNIVGYQGYFGEGVKDAVGNINSAPKDGDDYFTYYLNADLNKYQLAGFMENEVAYNSNVVSAVDYASRYINVRGEKLGLLTDSNKSPLQSLGLTGLDILNTTSSYTAYFTNSQSLNGTGKILMSMLSLSSKNIAKYDTGLVFYGDMETLSSSGSKSVLKDFSSYGNNFYISGTQMSYTNGIVGKASKFVNTYNPGRNNFYYNENFTGTLFSGNFTVSARTNIGSNTITMGNANGIVCKMNNDSGAHGLIIRNLAALRGRTGTNYINYGVFDSPNGTRFNPNIYTYDKWVNVVMVYDTTNGYLKGYLDGKMIQSSAITNSVNPVTTMIKIGACYDNGSEGMNGLIDEVRIYNRALSDSEVLTLYNATN